MALRTVDGLLSLGSLLSIGQKSLLDTHVSPQTNLGVLSFLSDSFGPRIFRYVRFLQSGGMARGELCDRVALVTGTVDAPANAINDTTHATDAANFTVGNEAGKVFQVNVAAGTAREGQTALIVANTVDILTFDARYPLSAAIVVGDTFSDWGQAHYDDAAAGTNRINIGGIVMGDPAVGEFGWVQVYGFNPAVFVDASGGAPTAGAQGLPGAASVLVKGGAETAEDYLGWFPMASSTTAVQAGFVIDVFNQSQAVV
jgi:hypothetical protein